MMSRVSQLAEIAQVVQQQPAMTGGGGGINQPPSGADVAGEAWPEGDLPSQGGGFMPTLMPGISTFRIPDNIAQCWDTKLMKDARKTLPNGQPNPKYNQDVPRNVLKFDKNNPLVIVDGPNKDIPMSVTWSSQPRPRPAKDADKPETPWISDLAYMLDIGLNDKSRPATADALKQRINQYAGKTIRFEHGLTARCAPDKVRYIVVTIPNPNFNKALPVSDDNPLQIEQTIKDPQGTKGCADDTKRRADDKGKKGRYYTQDFKDPTDNTYMDQLQCDCGAVLRGFAQFERFVPPLGTGK